MIYYPLSTLMLAGIREMLIISTPRDLPVFEELLGDGSQLGMRFEYAVSGAADEDWPMHLSSVKSLSGKIAVALVLGDNIFYGQSFSRRSAEAVADARRERSNDLWLLCKRSARVWCGGV